MGDKNSSLIPLDGAYGQLWKSGWDARERQLDITFRNRTWPYFMSLMTLYYITGRFDQCVIDKGAGLAVQLLDLQTQLYSAWSHLDKTLADTVTGHESRDEMKLMIHNRLNAYHRWVAGERDAYTDMLDCARDQPAFVAILERAMNMNRGGATEKEGLAWLIGNAKQLKEQTGFTWQHVATQFLNQLRAENPAKGTVEYEALIWLEDKSKKYDQLGESLRKRAGDFKKTVR